MAERQDGFTILFDDVVREYGTTGALVFGCVWRHCQVRDGYCHASIDTMAGLLGMNGSTVRRHLGILRECGMIRRSASSKQHIPDEYACIHTPEIAYRLGRSLKTL